MLDFQINAIDLYTPLNNKSIFILGLLNQIIYKFALALVYNFNIHLMRGQERETIALNSLR